MTGVTVLNSVAGYETNLEIKLTAPPDLACVTGLRRQSAVWGDDHGA